MQVTAFGKSFLLRGFCITQIVRCMKLISFLLFTCCLQVAASGWAQNVTMDLKNVPVQRVFTELSRQTGISIMYSEAQLKGLPPVSIHVKEAPLLEVLDQCLKGQLFTYSFEDNLIVIKNKPAPSPVLPSGDIPPIFITGHVVDSTGAPLAGASISIKGKSYITTTDSKGQFTMEASPGDVLSISYVGYKTSTYRITPETTVLFLQLTAAVAVMDELSVVSTGYQIIPRERSAGSFSKPDMKVLGQRTGSMNILQRLDGLIPGLTVNNSPNFVVDNPDGTSSVPASPFLIRGLSTVNSNRNPLYVLDGMAIDDVSFINPQDVADITVLKDATAASIWGARASNGVIVITTKQGRRNDHIRVTYDGFVNWKGKPNLRNAPVLNSRQFIQAAKDVFDPVTYPWESVSAYQDEYSAGVAPHEMIQYNLSRGLITAAQANASLDSLGAINNVDQIRRLWYRNAMLVNHTISVEGGGKVHSFYGSLTYTNNQSSTPGEKNETYKMNLRQDFRLNERMQMYLITDLNSNTAAAKRPITVDSRFYPYQLFEDAGGHPLPMSYMQYLSDDTREDYAARSRINLDYVPIDEFDRGYTKSDNLLARINAGITVNLFKGLKFEGVYGYIKGSGRTRTFDDQNSYRVRSQLVQFTQADNTTVQPVYYLPVSGGNYGVTNTGQRNWSVRNQLTYDNNWGGRHQLNLLFGQEAQEKSSWSNTTNVLGYDDALQTYSSVDYKSLTNIGVMNPVMPKEYGQSILSSNLFSNGEVLTRFTSWFGNAAYVYRSKYALNGSWRVDKSNLFGLDKSAQNRPVMSGGGKWTMSRENFLKNNKWLNFFALRLTYGITGNAAPPGTAASFDILQGSTSSFYPNGNGLLLSSPANKKLSWERTATINAGIDFSLLNWLSGNIDFYRKKTNDLIGTLPLNSLSGYSTVTGNFGDLENKGIELSLNSTNIQGRNFSWTTTLILSYNHNKITSLAMTDPITSSVQKINQNYLEGYPAFALFAYRYAGLDNMGDPQIYTANKTITKNYGDSKPEDVVYAGTYQPVWNGGFSNDLSYKGFDLMINMVYSLGNVMRRDANNFYTGRITHSNATNGNGFTTGNLNEEFAHRWMKPGDEASTNVPSYVSDQYISATRRYIPYYTDADINVISAAYIKLRDITLSYNLPKSTQSKLHTKECSIRFQLSNVMLWKANKYGIDPEFQNSLTATRTLPADQHSLSIGLRAAF